MPSVDSPRLAALFLLLGSALAGEELTVGFSYAKPPYVFAEASADDGTSPKLGDKPGIEIELFTAAMHDTGYQWRPVFWSFKRVIAELANGHLDAAETSGPKQAGIFYSHPLIACENYAISKKSAGLNIAHYEDLRQLTMVAWQGAATDLGPEFTKVVHDNHHYLENPDQQAQYQMFLHDRVQVVIIDRFIFRWWELQNARGQQPPAVVYHQIFPGVNEYRIGFHLEAAQVAFDAGLKRIRADGTYDKIIAKYVSPELLILPDGRVQSLEKSP